MNRALLCSALLVTVSVAAFAAEDLAFPRFDVNDAAAPGDKAPLILPWKVVPLDPDYGGLWVVAGDLDGDGIPELVSAENVNVEDVHYTSAAVAQKLDGSVLWRWGVPDAGRKKWHHDVACQIHDLDGDGANDVVLATDGYVVALDGRTGREKSRFAIPAEASDCIVFCDLEGKGRPEDVLVKDRYRRIWAYNRAGECLWNVTEPGGYRTAHQPRPMDLDGDGRDEIMAGYAMLNADGSVRWVFKADKVDQRRGHLDCARVVRKGATPADWRIVLTCCGANDIAFVDGEGKTLWEVTGCHFESVDLGKLFAEIPGRQIVVDIDHRPQGEGPLVVLDEEGNTVGRIMTDYARHHALLDWTGDGLDEIVVARHGGLYDNKGQRIGTFSLKGPEVDVDVYEASILVGDMTGDAVPDVLITSPGALYIFKNEKGQETKEAAVPGTGLNFTLY